VIIVVVVLVVVIGIVGILAAIAIPNLLTAMQRSKQKRTMADLRSVATAVEAWSTDHRKYPEAADMNALAPQLSPTYIKTVPRLDGWGKEMRYECWSSQGSGDCDAYALWSGGKDGVFEHDKLSEYEGGATTNFNDDIVFSNGSFVRYPQGAQTGGR
jgi:general secretion pathway protein G